MEIDYQGVGETDMVYVEGWEHFNYNDKKKIAPVVWGTSLSTELVLC